MRLGVNIDHVATVRQARRGKEPDPIAAAVIAELAGADGIVCHLREDRRHISDRDLGLLKQVVKTHLNLEMAANPEIISIACTVKPDMATLVPERREEITTEGGLNVIKYCALIKETVAQLHSAGIVVSLFIDPELEQVSAASETGTDFIELHTGKYADAEEVAVQERELVKINEMAYAAAKLDISVSAGHGLNYNNVLAIARLNVIEELNIGHSIISRAVFIGLEQAVRDMKRLIEKQ